MILTLTVIKLLTLTNLDWIFILVKIILLDYDLFLFLVIFYITAIMIGHSSICQSIRMMIINPSSTVCLCTYEKRILEWHFFQFRVLGLSKKSWWHRVILLEIISGKFLFLGVLVAIHLCEFIFEVPILRKLRILAGIALYSIERVLWATLRGA